MKSFLAVLASLVIGITSCNSQAQTQTDKEVEVQEGSKFKLGQHYDVVSENRSEKPNVTEFFSLFCGHCFQFEPFMDSLKISLPAGVPFKKSHVDYIPRDNKPVSFGIVKAFIVMGDLNKQKELTETFFAAIHLGQVAIETEDKIKEMFVENGVDAAQFDKLYNSESVIKRATAMTELWVEREISSVPTVVVNDKYKINMGAMQSMQDLLDITAYLLKQK